MANIKSIGGNPIVPESVAANSVTDAMLASDGVKASVIDTNSHLYHDDDIPVYGTATGWALTGNGLSKPSTAYDIVKYAVHSGDVLRLSLANGGDHTYQWQYGSTVPASGTNGNLTGTPVDGVIDGIVTVPDHTTFLIVSTPKDNTTNSVKRHTAYINGFGELTQGKNLIGTEVDVLYPVPELHNGDPLTISTSDGLGSTKNVTINFFDKDGVYLNYYLMQAGTAIRSVNLAKSLEGARYIGYGNYVPDPAQPLQVEFGLVATSYEPYIGNAKLAWEYIRDHADVNLRSRTFNATYHTGASDFRTKCQQFSALMYGDTIADVTAPSDYEAFLFFTDPHFTEYENADRCQEYVAQIQKYYNSAPTMFCLCGGDWLQSYDTPAQACFKLGYIGSFMRSMFDGCHMLVGNHDTNYQGKLTEESQISTTRLSIQSINDLWYGGGSAYYEFDGHSTRFFCFDTQVESTTLSAYFYEQAEWFATKLLTNASEHVAIAVHVLRNTWVSEVTHALTALVLDIAKAFNDRDSITVNGNSYDFSAVTTGKVEFLIAGHYHDDANITINGIPCVVTANVQHDNTKGPTFDLVFVDYDAGEIKTVRVGDGSDRTISLASA